jgi:acyl-CoA dehydrogenase
LPNCEQLGRILGAAVLRSLSTRSAPISTECLYPLAFDTFPHTGDTAEYLNNPYIRLLVEFFQTKGLAELKREDLEEGWYRDWIDYQAKHGLYASVLSPKAYSTRGHQFDLLKLTRFVEVFAYFSPAHAYSLQVSFLGLFPILMGSNEALKKEAIAKLEAGGLFAFGVSERAHGSDLLANEFVLRPGDPSGWIADGAKCYIGNANAAGIITIMARECDAGSIVPGKRSPLVFFALRPSESPGFTNLRKVRTLGIRNAFVGEFAVRGHPVSEGDIISRHREAWAAIFGTVDFGKFFLGFGAVGICEHAFAEVHDHLRRRVLYGKPILAMHHLRDALAHAYSRLVAMKLYAYRALDYLQAAGQNDRRYVLFNAVQKARVSIEGLKVLGVLSECAGARGFETETYIESALREGPMIPALEGSTHINFTLAAQFIGTYFADSASDAPAPPGSVSLGKVSSDENPYWTAARDRNPKTTRFGHFLAAYESLRAIPNVGLFARGAEAFSRFAAAGVSTPDIAGDPGRQIAIGRCLSIVAYGQLVAENCVAVGVAPALVSVVFHALVADLTAESLALAALFPPGGTQRDLLREISSVPETSTADLEAVSEWIAVRYGVAAKG